LRKRKGGGWLRVKGSRSEESTEPHGQKGETLGGLARRGEEGGRVLWKEKRSWRDGGEKRKRHDRGIVEGVARSSTNGLTRKVCAVRIKTGPMVAKGKDEEKEKTKKKTTNTQGR